jgi:hypothetical protein
MNKTKLIGTWHLIEWDCTLDGRYHNHPFGADAKGQIIYTDDGQMSAILMRRQRPLFAKANLAGGSDEEKVTAVNGYVSYAGTYSLDGNLVSHHVQFSLLPNWIGTDLVRQVTWLEDGDLLLTALPEMTRSGKVVVNQLRWRKVERSLVIESLGN